MVRLGWAKLSVVGLGWFLAGRGWVGSGWESWLGWVAQLGCDCVVVGPGWGVVVVGWLSWAVIGFWLGSWAKLVCGWVVVGLEL